jgi:acyl-CoA synthetase (AMP-forming)/AMP-acid ligase II
MMFTSGTSGKPPKAVMTTHENILFVTETIIDFLGMEEGEKELNFMPLGSTGGLGHLHCGLYKGFHSLFFQCNLLNNSDSVFVDMLKTIREKGVTGFLGTPGLLHKFVYNHREDFRKSMKNVRYAASNVHPCPVELIEELFVLAPSTRFHTYYGLTEASRSVNHCYNDNPAHLESAGKPSKGVSIRVHDSDTKTGLGEICIKGPNLMSGYWGLSKQPFDDEGWFHTGDLGYMDDEGFVHIKGRIDSLINVAGLKFYPNEVEKLLESDETVVKAAVVGVHDTETFHRVVAAIETSSETLDENELRQRLNILCEQNIEYFKVPTEFVFLPELPRTDLGKVKYPEIVKLFSNQ